VAVHMEIFAKLRPDISGAYMVPSAYCSWETAPHSSINWWFVWIVLIKFQPNTVQETKRHFMVKD